MYDQWITDMAQFDFTPRQQEVLEQLCKGRSNKEIARSLEMAEATVKLHLTEIFRTMGVRNRSEAIIKASDLPITKPELSNLTDQAILEEFTNVSFDVSDMPWSQRVICLGRAIVTRMKKENAEEVKVQAKSSAG
jgi:DNA-binding CsgD family transcriptional regulator